MKHLSEYCKAYPYEMLAAFAGFPEPQGGADGAPPAKKEYLFVHDDYTVTEGIYHNEDVVIGDPTDEWKAFCRETLEFSPPTAEEEAVTPSDTESQEGDRAPATTA